MQSQIIDLLNDLRSSRRPSLLFICHDLAIVPHVADDVAVMLSGTVVEHGPTAQVIGHAQHPYTQLMRASVFPTKPPYGMAHSRHHGTGGGRKGTGGRLPVLFPLPAREGRLRAGNAPFPGNGPGASRPLLGTLRHGRDAPCLRTNASRRPNRRRNRKGVA